MRQNQPTFRHALTTSCKSFDRIDKGWIYAMANIPVFWIINLVENQIEVYTDPQPSLSPASYTTLTVYLPGQELPIVLDGTIVATIPVSWLLP